MSGNDHANDDLGLRGAEHGAEGSVTCMPNVAFLPHSQIDIEDLDLRGGPGKSCLVCSTLCYCAL